MDKKIVLTGGGTAGHVTPNIALLPRLKELGYDIYYIGSKNGIEKNLMEKEGIPYFAISSGKFRRYMSMKNLTDPFKVVKGLNDAGAILKKLRPDIVFSKGGFVSVPVVRAAAALKIPVIAHESDMTPGLANRLSLPYVKKVCCNFPETLKNLPKDKAVLSGSPIRKELLSGSREKGLAFTGLSGDKPILMIVGGSLGAAAVNDAVRASLPVLLSAFDVVHLCGKEKRDETLDNTPGYRQYEYISEEMADLFALSDLIISRAGANAICEIAALNKPNILIPLPAKASRGDQILNAESFEKRGFSVVLDEEILTEEIKDGAPSATLISAVSDLYENRERYITCMKECEESDSIGIITGLLEKYRNTGNPRSSKRINKK